MKDLVLAESPCGSVPRFRWCQFSGDLIAEIERDDGKNAYVEAYAFSSEQAHKLRDWLSESLGGEPDARS